MAHSKGNATLEHSIPISKPSIGEKEGAYVLDAVRSGWVSSIGKQIEQFERAFAAYCGTRYAASAQIKRAPLTPLPP